MTHRDHASMHIIVILVLAAAVIVGAASFTQLPRDREAVSRAIADDSVETLLYLRARTIERCSEVTGAVTATLLEQHFATHAAPWEASGTLLGTTFNARLAAVSEGAEVIECDGEDAECDDGTDDDLVDPDGTYFDRTCAVTGTTCIGDVAYDGASDGIVRDADGRLVAALVWIELATTQGAQSEVLVLEPT